jgi:uncharacterized protein
MSEDKTSLKEVVASYLRKHPDFFNDHPGLLQEIELKHESGGASSLIERQVDQLRSSNLDLNKQLNRLVQVASDNEQLMSRLHRLTLDLMTIDSRREFFTQLGNSLLNDFNADILQICLFDKAAAAEAGEDVMAIDIDDPELEPFRAQLEKCDTVCGRLGESKLEFLFGSKARWVQSTAVVPIGATGADGMMAIGSSDPARFYPGMGTLFLDLLANVISTRLAAKKPEAQRRSA